jgi:peptidoglycan/LPS O-acetylase OafA/YrhL
MRATHHWNPTRSRADNFRFSENNFDLIRLIAAGEVAVRHSLHHISPDMESSVLIWVLDFIPGVPIFFFLSGYLISRSWERSPSPRDFFHNRALRLFPALWLCTTLSVVLLFVCGYLATVEWSPYKLGLWFICQGSVVQFWNPDFLRGFGVGVVNGSLWSVSVEIQFYIATAVMYCLLGRLSRARFDIALVLLVCLFALANFWGPEIYVQLDEAFGTRLAGQCFKASFVPWFFMFLLGVLAQRRHEWIVPRLLDRASVIFVGYFLVVIADHFWWGSPLGNNLPFYLVPLLGVTVLTIAYSAPTLSRSVLGSEDWSYGLYIYHMPLVNLALWLGYEGSVGAVFVVLGASVLIAGASWRFIERPMLRRKKSTVRGGSSVGVPALIRTAR